MLLSELSLHVCWNLCMIRLSAEIISKDNRLLFDQVYESLKTTFLPNGDLDWDRRGTQALTNHLHCTPEIGANTIHFINKADTGDIILIRLTPYSLRLWFNTRNRIKDDDTAIQNTQRSLDLSRKVYMAGRIDDVDAVVEPKAGRSG